jgi:hypothetical protein
VAEDRSRNQAPVNQAFVAKENQDQCRPSVPVVGAVGRIAWARSSVNEPLFFVRVNQVLVRLWARRGRNV